MLVEETRENELNLEKIDLELRMEKIRQNAAKLSWDGFGHAVRRNLVEKRIGFDAEGRIDVLQAISFLRKKIPVDENMSFTQKLKQLAESLECHMNLHPEGVILKNADVTIEVAVDSESKKAVACKISYWDGPLEDSFAIVQMLNEGKFAEVRTAVFSVLATLPSNVSNAEKTQCREALRALENHLNLNTSGKSFEEINQSSYGLYIPRTPIRPARLYFVAEPSFVRASGRLIPDEKDLDQLPYLEMTYVACEKDCQLPIYHKSGELRKTVSAKICLCLRFSNTMLLSQSAGKLMENIMARAPLVRHYTNLYRFMCGKENDGQKMVLRTRLPEAFVQHKYDIDVEFLKNENDSVVLELYLKELSQLKEVISILRSEWMHNNMWESMLAMCQGGRWKSPTSLRIRSILTRTFLEFAFVSPTSIVNVQLIERTPGNWVVMTIGADGAQVDPRMDLVMTDRLISSWNIPYVLTLAVQHLQCYGSPDDGEGDANATTMTSKADFTSHRVNRKPVDDKSSTAWSDFPFAKGKKTRPKATFRAERVVFGGLLASFKEVSPQFSVTLTSSGSLAEPRIRRLESDSTIAANVVSDLERIRQLVEAETDEDTANLAAASPAMRPPGQVKQLSPLETARLKMAQSMSAAAAVGRASCTPSTPGSTGLPETFDYTKSSSPASSTFGFSTPNYTVTQTPLGVTRGAAKARRPRSRKVGGIERSASEYSTTGPLDPPVPAAPVPTSIPMAQTAIRGRPTARRSKPPLVRKTSGTPRPIVARSFSEFNTTAPPKPHSAADAISPSGLSNLSAYADDDSEEEFDPPERPTKVGNATATAIIKTSGNPLGSMFGFRNSPKPESSSPTPTSSQALDFAAKKSSLEAAISKIRSVPVKRGSTSQVDIYDDGVPAEKRSLTIPPSSSATALALSAAMAQADHDKSRQKTLATTLSEALKRPPQSPMVMPKLEKQDRLYDEKPKKKDKNTPIPPPLAKSLREKEPKKRKAERKDSKESREPKEPKEKKSKTESKSKSVTSIINPIMSLKSLKNFKIPKKEEPPLTSPSVPSTSTPSTSEPSFTPLPTKEPASTAPTTSKEPSFTPMPTKEELKDPTLPGPSTTPAADFNPRLFGAFAAPVPSKKKKPPPPPMLQMQRPPDHMRGPPNRKGNPGRLPPLFPPRQHQDRESNRSRPSYQEQKTVLTYSNGIPGHASSSNSSSSTSTSSSSNSNSSSNSTGTYISNANGVHWVKTPHSKQQQSTQPSLSGSGRGNGGERSGGGHQSNASLDEDPGSPEETLRIADD